MKKSYEDQWRYRFAKFLFYLFAWFKCKNCLGWGEIGSTYWTDYGEESNSYECDDCLGCGRSSWVSRIIGNYLYLNGWY